MVYSISTVGRIGSNCKQEKTSENLLQFELN